MGRGRDLIVRILGDSSSAERAFKRTADAAEKVGPGAKVAENAVANVAGALTGRLGPASNVAEDALKGIGTRAIASGDALSLGLAGGAAVAGGALAAFAADGVSKFVDLAEEVRNFQRASGASAEESSRFIAVLDDLKISSEAGGTALFKLGREVAGGAPKLRQYGVEVAKNADGTASLTETLLNVADAYSKAPDQATRTAIAFAAFGKQAQTLLPLLEKGRKGLADYFEEAEKHGQILGDEDLNQARELELALDDLQDAIRGVQIVGAKALVPFLTDLTAAGTKALALAGDLDRKSGGFLRDVGASAVKELLGPVGDGVELLGLFSDESDKAKGSTEKLGGAADEAAGSLEELEAETRTAAEAHKEAEQAAKAHEQALRAVFRASEGVIGSQFAVADAEELLRDAHDEVAEKERELAEARAGLGNGAQRAAAASRALADAQRDSGRAASDAARDVADAERAYNEAAGKEGAGSDEAKQAAERLTAAREKQARAAEDAGRRLSDAERAVQEAQRGGGKARDVAEAAEAVQEARRAEIRATNDLAQARRDLAVTQAEAAGKAVDDAEKYRLYRDELIKLKDATAPGSELRKNLEGLINSLPPPEVRSRVVMDTTEAEAKLRNLLLGAGSLADVGNILNSLPTLANGTKADSGNIRADAGTILGPAASPPSSSRQRRDAVKYRAHGGPLNPGDFSWVGEKGVELLHMGSTGGQVVSNDQIREAVVPLPRAGERPQPAPPPVTINQHNEFHGSDTPSEAAIEAANQALAWRISLMLR